MKVATIIFFTSTALFAVQAVRFDVKNLEIGAIWVGVKEKPGKAVIEEGGFQLGAGQGVGIFELTLQLRTKKLVEKKEMWPAHSIYSFPFDIVT